MLFAARITDTMSISWDNARLRSDIKSLQDPTSGATISMDKFVSAYGMRSRTWFFIHGVEYILRFTGKTMDVLRGEGADASFCHFFVPSSTDSGSWVFASPAARQAFAVRAAACGCTSSSVDVNESDEEELDDDDDDVAIDEFVGLVSSPAYASVAAAVQAGSVGPQLVATVRPLIAGLGVREAAATVTRAVAEVCCLLSTLRACVLSRVLLNCTNVRMCTRSI